MARNRMIKPDFWDDEKLSTTCSRDARLTFIAMWNHSDDYGVVKGNHTWLKNNIYPYEEIDVQLFAQWLKELENACAIAHFEVAQEKFYYLRNFTKHQVINKPSLNRNPAPPQEIVAPCTTLPEDYRSIDEPLPSEKKLKEIKEKEKERCVSAFDSFWGTYPKHSNKKRSFEKWMRINPSPELVDIILNAIVNQTAWRKNAKTGEFRPEWKNPDTWLNNESWNDEVGLAAGAAESRYVKCRNPEKNPPCNTTWNLGERPNCPRCGWKYEVPNG